MEPSVSPLPIPLWPMLALSLTLFCVTTIAVTISARSSGQLSANFAQNSPEFAAPVLPDGQSHSPLVARANATTRSAF